MQPVDRAQVLAAPVGERLRLLFRPSETEPAGCSQTVDEKDLVTRELCESRVLHHLVEMGLAVIDIRR
jgi:hypothetical protein